MSPFLSCRELPDVGDDFAADAELAGVAVAHHALGRGNDGGAEATEDAGKVLSLAVDAQARLGDALDAADDAGVARTILEGDVQGLLGLRVLDGMLTTSLPAVLPLRMRVSMSAMGSVTFIGFLLR